MFKVLQSRFTYGKTVNDDDEKQPGILNVDH